MIELEIQHLLKNISEPALVADELLKKWHRGDLSQADIESVSKFLVAYGFENALADNLAVVCRDKGYLPWSAVALIVKWAKHKVTKNTVDHLLIGAGEQNGLENLTRSKDLDTVDERFGKIRAEMITSKRLRIEAQKAFYIEQADIAKNDRLAEKEQQILTKLKQLFPNDSQIRDRISEFNTRLAVEKISRVNSERLEIEVQKALQLDDALKAEGRQVLDRFKNDVSKKKITPYNASLSLMQMGLLDEALEILGSSSELDTPSVWLRIELLLQSHRYIDALSELDRIEKKLIDQPEMIFAVNYSRAIALWGLHQYSAAIQLLKQIVDIRPDYRSAHALLMEWVEFHS